MARRLPPSQLPLEGSAAEFVPPDPNLDKLRAAAAGCTACHLHQLGTQTVFGEGAERAEVMLVGEQPGDKEDLAGRPFVGPAGKLLDRALETAGIDRSKAYVTNTVKHFKWTPGTGRRRLHQTPNPEEIAACRPWLESEIAVVAPRIVVCLGATAAQAMLGRSFRVTKQRGEFFGDPPGPLLTATIHPSAILRVRTDAEREEALAGLVDDLRLVAERLAA